MEDNKFIDHIEAWDDFYQFITTDKTARPMPFARELYECERVRRGLLFSKRTGKVIAFGPSRVKRIIEKYAPNRYACTINIEFYKK